jgi:hypothetical protein
MGTVMISMEEYHEKRKELCASSGHSKASCSLFVFGHDKYLTITFEPYGYQTTNQLSLHGKGQTAEEAFVDVWKKWLIIKEDKIKSRTADMAKFIAGHLVGHDEVTAAQLRSGGFDDGEIVAYGEAACAMAAETVDKYPITIIKGEKSNGAPATVDDDAMPF